MLVDFMAETMTILLQEKMEKLQQDSGRIGYNGIGLMNVSRG